MLFRTILALFACLILPEISYAQKVKEWLDHNWEPLPAGKRGPYYRTVRTDANGTRHGLVISYYAEGKPRMMGNFKEGYFFGPFVYYYPDGQMEAKGNYNSGHRLGLWEEWYPNGKIRQQTDYVEQRITDNEFILIDHIQSFWDSTGNQLVKNGNGSWYSLHPNGKLFEQGRLVNFRKAGEWLEYDQDGNLERKEFFSDTGLQKGVYYGAEGTYEYNAETYETTPAFPGGQEALNAFLTSKLKYPAYARNRGIAGTVFMDFIVDTDGTLIGIHILKGIDGGCSEEALRVLKLSPAWVPARQRGKAVPMHFSLPIRFVLGTADQQHREPHQPAF